MAGGFAGRPFFCASARKEGVPTLIGRVATHGQRVFDPCIVQTPALTAVASLSRTQGSSKPKTASWPHAPDRSERRNPRSGLSDDAYLYLLQDWPNGANICRVSSVQESPNRPSTFFASGLRCQRLLIVINNLGAKR
jgi:hypothetical protein